MSNYNNLKKRLNENLKDKSDKELYNLSESLVAEFFKSYLVNDLQSMKDINATIDELKVNLKGKYGNVDAVFNGLELQKQKEYYVLLEYQHKLLYSKDNLLIYQLLLHELTTKVAYLKKLLLYYFLNTVGGDGAIGELDDIIADIKDDIIDLSGIANNYFKDSAPDDVNLEIETSKEIIHDMFNFNYLEFLKENGLVDIQMEMMEIYKLNHQCNKDYKQLKLEIDDLFAKNNGFKDISECFINMVKSETDVGVDRLVDYLPEYDVNSATFISSEFPIGA